MISCGILFYRGGNIVQSLVKTPLGPVSVVIENGFAVRILLGKIEEGVPVERVEPFVKQLEEYFEGVRKTLNFPVILEGTEFQKRVWRVVRDIPYGTVRTYGWVAKKIHTSPRAVGVAMRMNELPLYIPCHRVVSAKGIGGFSAGLEWKWFLLELEGVVL